MQGPPMDLRMPKTEHADEVSHMQWLIVITVLTTLVALIALLVIHGEHEYHGDRAMTPEFQACFNAEMNDAINEGRPSNLDKCKPVMPWYAEHPIGYAAIVGAAVFVIGRIGLFMYRMEQSRGY